MLNNYAEIIMFHKHNYIKGLIGRKKKNQTQTHFKISKNNIRN